MADQPCNKCQQPTQQLMAASSPFYTCNNPECVFHLPVASAPKEAGPENPDPVAWAQEGFPNWGQSARTHSEIVTKLTRKAQPEHGFRLAIHTGDQVQALQVALDAERARAERLAEALRWAERHCPCGARPESPDTRPHVPGCLVGAALAQEDRND